MKKFNEFSEALLVTLNPKSDAVAPVEACPCQQKDMLTQTADDVMSNLGGGEPIQPDDGIGEYGDNQAEGDESADGVELECTDDGLRVKFNGVEIVLPKNVVDKIKDHVEHEESETPAEEEAEQTEGDDENAELDQEETEEEEEESDEKKDDNVFESLTEAKKKNLPPWLKNKGKDKEDKDDKKECKCKSKGKGKWNFNKGK